VSIRVDHVEAIRALAKRLADENSDLLISLVSREYAEDNRQWSKPAQFRIVDDHPGMVVVEVRNIT
jgi:Ser-tRNA(Ala) deacylase AlaX